MSEKQYRYKGVKPFESTDRAIFFGRDEDIEELYNLILSENLVVLFGKSGYGKSSLLNAGVLPLFQESEDEDRRAMVVEVRLGTYVKDQTRPPLQSILAKLEEKFSEKKLAGEEHYLDVLFSEISVKPLWYHFKRRQHFIPEGRFILVFDQFEEFFSYPPSEQEQFKRELAELLFSDIPQYLRKSIPQLTPAEKRRLAEPMNVKAVFAIRSDRMSLLDSMTDFLPAILHKRFEIRPLRTVQARQAIVQPARMDQTGLNFLTSPFEFTDAALDEVLSQLSAGYKKGVEAFQLQILCQYIESQVEAGKIPDRDQDGMAVVDTSDLPALDNLYETYYRRQLDRLDESMQRQAQMVLEEGLLSEDLRSGEGRRMSVDSQLLKSQFGVTDALLRALENTYMVRKEPNSVGGESLEISHDTLVAPILKMKKERRSRDELEAAQKRELEAAKQAAIERRRRQGAYLLTSVALMGLVVAGWQYLNAKMAKEKAEVARLVAEEQSRRTNEAIIKIKEKIVDQMTSDEAAEFFDAAQMNRRFLKRIDSLDQKGAEPSLILDEVVSHWLK